MKKYQKPEAEITKFQSEDILVTSGALTDLDPGFVDGDLADWEE